MLGIKDGFKLLESGLFECVDCGTTFENENECQRHLEELEEEAV